MILCNFEHLAEISPYRASHAIYVCSGAVQAVPAVGEVPSILLRRMLSVRGFGADHCIQAAEVIEGRTLSAAIEAFFSKTVISYIHIHTAKHGCFASKRCAADAFQCLQIAQCGSVGLARLMRDVLFAELPFEPGKVSSLFRR